MNEPPKTPPRRRAARPALAPAPITEDLASIEPEAPSDIPPEELGKVHDAIAQYGAAVSVRVERIREDGRPAYVCTVQGGAFSPEAIARRTQTPGDYIARVVYASGPKRGTIVAQQRFAIDDAALSALDDNAQDDEPEASPQSLRELIRAEIHAALAQPGATSGGGMGALAAAAALAPAAAELLKALRPEPLRLGDVASLIAAMNKQPTEIGQLVGALRELRDLSDQDEPEHDAQPDVLGQLLAMPQVQALIGGARPRPAIEPAQDDTEDDTQEDHA